MMGSDSEAARGEPENLERGGVQPLRIVDERRDLLTGSKVAEQVQRCQGDEEDLRASARRPEGVEQRLTLSVGQAVDPAEHGSQQLVQAGEGHPRLRLHSCRAQHNLARFLGVPASFDEQG